MEMLQTGLQNGHLRNNAELSRADKQDMQALQRR